MIGETYPFLSEDYIPATDELFFTFLSQGEQVIPKIVAYTPVVKGGKVYFNWGFGDLIYDNDLKKYIVDDKVESNNGDAKTIFYTVVSTLSLFFEIHPDATVYITGSNRQRLNVYKALVTRHWKQIEPYYEIKGYGQNRTSDFVPGMPFEFLLISRKKT